MLPQIRYMDSVNFGYYRIIWSAPFFLLYLARENILFSTQTIGKLLRCRVSDAFVFFALFLCVFSQGSDLSSSTLQLRLKILQILLLGLES